MLKKQPHFYIGETTSVSRRIASHKHKLRKLKHGNSSLQVDWQVLGESQFEFIVLHCGPEWQDASVRKYYEQRLIAFCSKMSFARLNYNQLGPRKSRIGIDLNQRLRKQTYRINKILRHYAKKQGLTFKKRPIYVRWLISHCLLDNKNNLLRRSKSCLQSFKQTQTFVKSKRKRQHCFT